MAGNTIVRTDTGNLHEFTAECIQRNVSITCTELPGFKNRLTATITRGLQNRTFLARRPGSLRDTADIPKKIL